MVFLLLSCRKQLAAAEEELTLLRSHFAAAEEQLALLRNQLIPPNAGRPSPQRRTLAPLVRDDDLGDFLRLVPIYLDDLLPRGMS